MSRTDLVNDLACKTEKQQEPEDILLFEKHVERQREEILAWMYAYACVYLDRGLDLRKVDFPSIAVDMRKVFSK